MSDQAASMSIDTTPAASAAEDAGGAEETGDSAEGGASKKAIKKVGYMRVGAESL